jgi:excisionase family DNA binding protein
MLSIKEVCEQENLSEIYVRRMIQKGKIETTKVPLEGHKGGFKHMITEEEVIRWRKESNHSRRTDGRSRYVLYGTTEEIEELGKLVTKDDLGVIIQRQNKVKSVESEE